MHSKYMYCYVDDMFWIKIQICNTTVNKEQITCSWLKSILDCSIQDILSSSSTEYAEK